jgi:protocatechuate 3,4-dioxygenase beta subunit
MRWTGTGAWTRARFTRLLLAAPIAYVVAACTRNDTKSDTTNTAGTANPTTARQTSGASTATTTAVQPAGSPGALANQLLQPTPECGDEDDVTPTQTEGPYFTPNSPERTSLLEADASGERLALSGHVVSRACSPIAGALIDFWQADDAGEYDNSGYRYRGHQFTDDTGRYQLETVIPGLYPGRTRHIHVKVQAPGQRVLTTQLYFPNEARNARDGIYREECLIDIHDDANGKTGAFTFVLDV